MIPDENSVQPDDQALDGATKEIVQRALNELSMTERQVIILRHGLGNEEPRTLEEVASKLGPTRERIRQIELAGLEKLAQNIEIQQMHEMSMD